MDLHNFTEPQRQSLLDLAALAMYSDGHLAQAEDERVVKLLSAFGLTTESDRNNYFDASISRIRGHLTTSAGVRAHAISLAQNFSSSDQRHQVSEFLGDLVASDNKVSPQETGFIDVVEEALRQ